ncbi:MAG: cation:proton antiporter [Planctomycetota bacterium]|nr:cation:proton antiporter [Planctomycetota bacterium]
MEHGPFIVLTALTLGAAGLAWLLQRVGLSPILGYLAIGIFAAPVKNLLLEHHEDTEVWAEFGVILLMFFIGLEFHLEHLKSMLSRCLVGGGLQVGLTALAAGGIAWLLGAPVAAAIVVGMMVAFSSTALVMKTFADRREADSARAKLCLAVLLFQDIAAILAVAFLPLLAGLLGEGGEGSAWDAIKQMGFLFVVLPLLFLGSRYVLPRLFERTAIARLPEAFSLLSLGACLSVALAAEHAGASLALGAFLGGLVLADTPFSSQILADLSTLRNLALAFFFVSVGLLVDLSFVGANLHYLAGAMAGMLVLKLSVAAGSLLVLKVPATLATGTGLALAHIGEFSFVLGRQAQGVGLLDGDAYKFVLALAVLSMVLAPFEVSLSGRMGALAGRLFARGSAPAGAAEDGGDMDHEHARAIVVGYGPVGKTLTRLLNEFGVRPFVIDLNLETVKRLKNLGIASIYGDASRREILEAAGAHHADFLLVTLPDLESRSAIVATARLLNPELVIISRARYLTEKVKLEAAGAQHVSFEEIEVSMGLARALLEDLAVPEEEIRKHVRRIRREVALRSGFTMVMSAAPRPRRSTKPIPSTPDAPDAADAPDAPKPASLGDPAPRPDATEGAAP